MHYQPKHLKQQKRRGIYTFAEWFFIIALGVLIAFFLRSFVLESYVVPTGSMLDTIQLQDHLLGEKVSLHFLEPKQGDIVTFLDPEKPDIILVKRVIATEGQELNIKDRAVFVDGKKLEEPYTEGKPNWPFDRYLPRLKGPIQYPYKVPKNCVWVMGDNRTNSLDSRYFGAIPISSIASKIVLRIWPPDRFGPL